MPTYDYACAKCGLEFEVFHSMKDKPVKICPTCGKKGRVRRKIGGGSGIIFKGTGFYETDYKRKSSIKPSLGDSAASTNESKADTKSASSNSAGKSSTQ